MVSNNQNVIIEASKIYKRYEIGDHSIDALCNVSLSIHKGEIISIMGPSGSGKTTLLNCLSGMDEVTSGDVNFEGKHLHRLSNEERDRFRLMNMGFVFQNNNLIPILSAVENVELPLLCQRISPKAARKKAIDALSRVGLKERVNHRPSELSLGQQQRVSLARSIVNDPKIVLADEPTGALDKATSILVLDLIEHLNRVDGITFMIVTHDPVISERAHRTVYMDSGMLIC